MALKTPLYKSCIPLFTFCLINWNNKCTAVPSGRPVPGFLFQLLFQRSNFGLQSSNCSFEFGLHSSLHLLQLTLQLFVLPLQLLPSIFILLCSWALCCQLIVQLLCLQGWEWMLSEVLYAFREMTGGSLGWQFSKYLFRTTNNFRWHTNRKWHVLKWALPAVLLSSCDHPLPLCCFAPLLALPPVGQFLPPGAVSRPEGLSCKFKVNKRVVMALTSWMCLKLLRTANNS